MRALVHFENRFEAGQHLTGQGGGEFELQPVAEVLDRAGRELSQFDRTNALNNMVAVLLILANGASFPPPRRNAL
jgi:hypothetical protein